jgi:carbon-monoxide dehydrogenase large subunit
VSTIENWHARRVKIGEPVRRKEDRRLVTGDGRYSDDIRLAGQCFAIMVRSPHAHAKIISIDSSAALAHPGVLVVLTAKEAAADGLKPIPHTPAGYSAIARAVGRDGVKFQTQHFPLAVDKVRFVGDAVAIIVAETLAGAEEAAELVEVQYESLAAVTDTFAATQEGAPLLWTTGSNICTEGEIGDKAGTDEAFKHAAHIAKLSTWIQRVTAAPMEPRAAVGSYDAESKQYLVHAGSGGSVRLKEDIVGILDVPPEQVRVAIRDIGGNFGTKNTMYPEFALVAWAARRVGRPVKWCSTRRESFLSDYQGRDLVVVAELALDADGKFLAIRSSNTSNVGAYCASFVPLTKGLEILTGVYRVPVGHFHGRGVCSNTAPTSPYRSAGRPEAIFVIERLIDIAARDMGLDRVALRRLNLINGPVAPYRNAAGVTYDGGDYEGVMNRALALGNWADYPARKAEALKKGRLRGIGLANYIEVTHGAPRERAEVTIREDGQIDVVIGTLSAGQGHETSFAQLVSDWLDAPLDRINLITGDTNEVTVGGGSHSSRSMRFASIVIGHAVDEIVVKGKRLAALIWGVNLDDVDFAEGQFTLRGADANLSIFDVNKAAITRNDLPDDLRGELKAFSDKVIRDSGYPYGCHVCEVDIDRETGKVTIVNYVTVDDVGRAVNPMIIHGQTHGGIAQGVGQALMEKSHYERETGQLISASFMDHAIPRASSLPSFVTDISEVPSPSNPVGIRAGGEGGTTGALAAVANAVVDALAEFGVTHIDMPITSEKVWQATRPAAPSQSR